jgi:hypothetical protein
LLPLDDWASDSFTQVFNSVDNLWITKWCPCGKNPQMPFSLTLCGKSKSAQRVENKFLKKAEKT